jgi:predicted polyphosphate/ATP-dependent NAD kinase
VGARRLVTQRPADQPAAPAGARLGLIVNPIAGMGGRVGLKGTDGAETLERALALGAEPVAPGRAVQVARGISDLAARMGIEPQIEHAEPMSALGTRHAAARLRDDGADLLLFVGGDGTARDMYEAVGLTVPVLGVPAGVKMHSGVFATGTRTAADAAVAWLASRARRTREAEVVDIDEAALREGSLSVRLYGTLLVPDVPGRIQSLKASGGRAQTAEVAAVAAEVVRRVGAARLVVLGPGTTTRAVGDALGVETTLLGVDVVELDADGGRATVIARDVGEAAILATLDGRAAVAVVSPTGGQGFLLGRGNQQLSPAVLNTVGLDRLLIVATLSKLAALQGRPLYVDTGDAALDAALAGHRRVITGRGQETVVRVDAA